MKSTVKKFILLFSLLLTVCLILSACAGEEEAADLLTVPDSPAQSVVSDTDVPVRITELMAANKTVLMSDSGLFPDWIELTNTGSEEFNLSGCGLSDDINKPFKWTFPECIVKPGERIVVYCTNKETSENNGLSTGFSLSRGGECVYFSQPSGALVQSVAYNSLNEDMSLCIDENNSYVTYEATPGYPNTEEGRDAFVWAEDRHGALTINEAVVYNDSYWFIHGAYYDWVELKNTSDDTILLSDYYITDSSSDPFRCRLPAVSLRPGELYVILCIGDADLSSFSVDTADFALNASGDTVFVYTSEGDISDRVGLYNIPLRGSIGRIEGERGFFYFENPTPDKQNKEGFRQRTAAPKASIEAGVYNDVKSLEVELYGDGTIYYTLDGSEPNCSSRVYSEPIEITSTSNIRTAAIETGKMISKTASFSYVVNENHTIPVVSVTCNPQQFKRVMDFWGDHDMYCDANVSYFGEDGSFSKDCALKLHGSSGREVLTKKHFKLVFADRYGGDLNYDVFDDGQFTQFHSLLLRGDYDSIHLYRDSLASLVTNKVSATDAYTLNSKYCILYINGEYWGIYAIREAYSQKYAAEHSGDREKDIIIKRAPVYEYDNPDSLTNLFTYICSKDMNNPEYYAYVSDRFDLESLAQWLCLESYFNNADPTGNIRYFKSTANGSKWKMMFFDLDQSMSNNYTDWGLMTNLSCQIGRVCNSLRRSDYFREQLLSTAAQLVNNGLSSDTVLSTFQDMIDELSEEMPRNLKRWKETEDNHSALIDWQKAKFTPERTEKWLEGLKIVVKADDKTMHEYFPDYY